MQAWRSRLSGNGPLLVSLALAALLAADGARVMLLVTAHAPSSTLPVVADREARPRRSANPDVQAIVAAHLFGIAAEESSNDPATAVASTANLTLLGTLATQDPRHGLAIITGDASAKVYKVGESVSGASLHSVYVDRVVLSRGGRLETLSLPRAVSNSAEARPPRSAGKGVAPEPADQRHLAELMNLEPSEGDSEKLLGYRVRPNGRAAPLIQSGLRPGDMMTAINGTSLLDQDRHRSQELVDAMLASNNATLTVLRGGQSMDVFVDASQ